VPTCVPIAEFCVPMDHPPTWPTMAADGVCSAGQGDDGEGKEKPRRHLLI